MTDEERLHEEDLQRIRGFRLLDDDFMNACFKDNPEAVELILRIILEDEGIQVTDIETQVLMKNLLGRDIWLDIEARDSAGHNFNVEVQRSDKGAGFKRARYHSSIMDANLLKSGEDYNTLPETYVIFITESDIIGAGKPIYHIDRQIAEMNMPFDDEEHIIYVNAAYEDELTDLGKMVHDFRCTNPDDMYFDKLAKKARYFKTNDEGVISMCKVLEDMRNEVAWNKTVEFVLNLIKDGDSYEKIARVTGMTVDQVQEIANGKSA